MDTENNKLEAVPGATPAEERAKAILANAGSGAFSQPGADDAAPRPGATPAEVRALEAIGAAMEAGMPLEQAAKLAARVGPACEALNQLSEQAQARARSSEPASQPRAAGPKP